MESYPNMMLFFTSILEVRTSEYAMFISHGCDCCGLKQGKIDRLVSLLSRTLGPARQHSE
jgi:hypothetical protein